MATKTWKLGEICQGGVITVETKGQSFDIIAKEWDFSTGSRKSSNQSNAKEFNRKTFSGDVHNDNLRANDFLYELATSYWADEIMKWVKTKVDIKTNSFW